MPILRCAHIDVVGILMARACGIDPIPVHLEEIAWIVAPHTPVRVPYQSAALELRIAPGTIARWELIAFWKTPHATLTASGVPGSEDGAPGGIRGWSSRFPSDRSILEVTSATTQDIELVAGSTS